LSRYYHAYIGETINIFNNDLSGDGSLRTTEQMFVDNVALLSDLNHHNLEIPMPIVQATKISDKQISITSTGSSDDNSASRSVSHIKNLIPALVKSSGFSLIVKGEVNLNGTGNLQNLYHNSNIWSGGGVNFTEDAKTYIADQQLITDKTHLGIDILDNDTALMLLEDEPSTDSAEICDVISDKNELTFFRNFFNTCPSGIKNYADLHTDYRELPSQIEKIFSAIIPPHNALIWIDNEANDELIFDNSINNIYGCTRSYVLTSGRCETLGQKDPVMLIIDSDVNIMSDLDVYGLLYIKGDLKLSATVNVYGAVIVEGSLSGSGNLNVYYDPAMIKPAAFRPMLMTEFNSWKDW